MRRIANVVAAALFMLFLWSPNSHAVGLGLCLDGSTGSGENEWDNGWYSTDLDSKSAGFGFVLDTSPTNERVFNYRLQVGYAKHELDQDDGAEFDTDGIYVENTFGFAMVKNENFRWWAGPLVRAGYYYGDSSAPGFSVDGDVDYGEFGIGAATGVNFRAGNTVISPSIGFRYSGFYGEADWRTWEGSYYTEDIEVVTRSFFANIALLF